MPTIQRLYVHLLAKPTQDGIETGLHPEQFRIM